MTPNQVLEFAAFKARHEADEAYIAQLDLPPTIIRGVEPFPCDVPGMLCVVTDGGHTLALLYPEPRPVPRDPQFQHAEDLSPWPRVASALVAHGREGRWRRDWQWRFVLMDAPSTMPAGACQSFDYGDDTYGAQQMTWEREA